MPAVQSLKKQLRGIRSTQKLTKAMKTTSTVKFSKLSGLYSQYADYGDRCAQIQRQYGADFYEAFHAADSAAPPVVVVLASNKGLCGSFNADILQFALQQLTQLGPCRLIACGREAISFFAKSGPAVDKNVVFNDVPTYEESCALLDAIAAWRADGTASRVYVIYPKYINMMIQQPAVQELFSGGGQADDAPALLIPERNTVIEKTAGTVFRATLYRLVLEAALGAQAATLMTMRSAYQTATDYCAQLEGEINRLRQSSVTADIIETSAKSDA